MEIYRYESDLLLSNMYIITEGDKAIVVDPFRDIHVAKSLSIEKIILTHEHYDHISGVNLWKEMTGAHILCSKMCAENIQNPKKNLARLFDVFCSLQTWLIIDIKPNSDENYTCIAEETFQNEMRFEWYGHNFYLFEIPGHSLGSIGILLDNQYFFSGDSLMENEKIELRLPGGSKSKWESIGKPRIAALPNGIMVYPGHFQEFIYNTKKGV